MYIHIHICLCVYVHTCIYTYAYMYVIIHIYTHTRVHVYIYLYNNTHTRVHVYIYLYNNTHTRVHVYIYLYICVHHRTEGMEAEPKKKQDCTIFWYKKSILEFEMTTCSELLHSNSNCRSLLGLPVICNYPEDGSNFVRKCHTWKDCCDS